VEIVKARVHRGQPAAMSFSRDREGLEVDAVIECSEGRIVLLDAGTSRTPGQYGFCASPRPSISR
jgi:hypothetical protein